MACKTKSKMGSLVRSVAKRSDGKGGVGRTVTAYENAHLNPLAPLFSRGKQIQIKSDWNPRKGMEALTSGQRVTSFDKPYESSVAKQLRKLGAKKQTNNLNGLSGEAMARTKR